MNKFATLEHIHRHLVIGVVRESSASRALSNARAYVSGGVAALEISSACPKSGEIIGALKEQYGDQVAVGAGTVLDNVTARIMMLAGADFIAAPSFSQPVAEMCHLYQTFYMPACYTSNEIAEILKSGLSVVKLFPGDLYTPATVRVMKNMYEGLEVIAAGGVNEENLTQWLDLGVWALGLALPGLPAAEITEKSRSFIALLKKSADRALAARGA